ncbi:MAG: aminotransferase class I/II-fold pyridoxal phosphate-dependent enzyme [Planctomycetes bacterium]|nr:aminotransferase class I/II-fold pyridoxal phosphate-dependent enzyme [Planctomycetota bacterium]
MDKVVDLRSDTLTCPNEEMRQAMAAAAVGDDCHGEDPTVAELERLAAERIGKGTALYCPSGTMGNSIGIMSCTDCGGVVLAEEFNHTGYYEREGIEQVSHAKFQLYEEPSGLSDPAKIEAIIKDARNDGVDLRALALENSFNVRGGVCLSPAQMKELCDLAHSNGMKVHLDGARIFNAAAYLGCDVQDIAREVDTVMFCLSKGLGAPVGSMIAGDADKREFLHRCRKKMGGGMRQAGIIAAGGMIALTQGPDRCAIDNANGRFLAESLAGTPGLHVDLDKCQTNITMIHLDTPEKADELCDRCAERGVKFFHILDGMCRLVCYNAIEREDCEYAVGVIQDVMKEIES